MKTLILVLCMSVCVSGVYQFGRPMPFGMSRAGPGGDVIPGGLFPISYAEAWPVALFVVNSMGPWNSLLFIKRREAQIVAGTMYHLSFWVFRGSPFGGYVTLCHTKVWSRPWLNKIEITSLSCFP